MAWNWDSPPVHPWPLHLINPYLTQTLCDGWKRTPVAVVTEGQRWSHPRSTSSSSPPSTSASTYIRKVLLCRWSSSLVENWNTLIFLRSYQNKKIINFGVDCAIKVWETKLKLLSSWLVPSVYSWAAFLSQERHLKKNIACSRWSVFNTSNGGQTEPGTGPAHILLLSLSLPFSSICPQRVLLYPRCLLPLLPRE